LSLTLSAYLALAPAYASAADLSSWPKISAKGIRRLVRTVWSKPLLPLRSVGRSAEEIQKTRKKLIQNSLTPLSDDEKKTYLKESASIARETDPEIVRKKTADLLSGVTGAGGNVVRTFGRSVHTAMLITAATAASMVKQQVGENNLRSGAMLDSEDPTKNKVPIQELGMWEGYLMDVPLDSSGALHLGSHEQPWGLFQAPGGTARVRVEAFGEILEIENVFNAQGAEILIPATHRFLENSSGPIEANGPAPEALLIPHDFDQKQKICNRCIKIYKPGQVETIRGAIRHVLDLDLFHSMAASGGSEMLLALGPMRFLQTMISNRVSSALLVSYLTPLASMFITFQPWEGGAFLTEMAKELIADPKDRAAADGALLRLGNDFFQTNRFRLKANAKLASIYSAQTESDLRVIGMLYSNMWLILQNNEGWRQRLLAGAYRERIWTADFMVTVAGLSSIGPITNGVKYLMKSTGKAALARTPLARMLLKQMTGARAGRLLLRGAVRLGTGLTSAGVFLGVVLALDSLPPEEKDFGTVLIKRAGLKWRKAQIDALRLQLASQLALNGPSVGKILLALTRTRESAYSELNLLRDADLTRIEQRDLEIQMLVASARMKARRAADIPEPAAATNVPDFFRSIFAGKAVDLDLAKIRERDTAIAPLKESMVAMTAPAIFKLYEEELRFLAMLFGMQPKEIKPYLSDFTDYDVFEDFIRPHALKFGANSRKIIRYFLTVLMNRNHVVSLLAKSPEAKWADGVLAERRNHTKVPVDVFQKYFKEEAPKDPMIAALSMHPELLQQYKQGNEEASQAEEAERKLTRVFGWNEIETAQGTAKQLRNDAEGGFQYLIAFPDDDSEEWRQIY
jgi:hypothetical protein